MVVLGLGHGAGLHRLRHARVVGHAEHGDALEALLLQHRQQLRAHEDDALDHRGPRVGLLRGFEGTIEVVEDLDELQEQVFPALVEAVLEVASDALSETLVLGLELPVGVQDLGEPVLGEVRTLLECVGRAGIDQRVALRGPDAGGKRILLRALRALRRVVIVQQGLQGAALAIRALLHYRAPERAPPKHRTPSGAFRGQQDGQVHHVRARGAGQDEAAHRAQEVPTVASGQELRGRGEA